MSTTPWVLPLITADHRLACHWRFISSTQTDSLCDSTAAEVPNLASRDTLADILTQGLSHAGFDATGGPMSNAPHNVLPPAPPLATRPRLSQLDSAKDFTPRRQAHFSYPIEVWETHKEEIRRIYLDERETLGHVMEVMSKKGFRPTTKMYKTRLRAWGFVKYKRRDPATSTGPSRAHGNSVYEKTLVTPKFPPKGKSLAPFGRLTDCSPRFPYSAPVGTDQRLLRQLESPQPLRFQELVVGQFANLFSKHLALADDTVPPYWKSNVSETIFFIWEGASLMNQGHSQGYKVLRRGFHNLLSLFTQHTFYAITHLFFFAAPWCNKTINQVLWKYLASHSTHNLHKTHELQRLLEYLVEFFDMPSYSDDAMTATRVSILEQFYTLNGDKDHSLNEIVSRAPLKIQRRLVWRDAISNSSRQQINFLRSQYGSADSRYLDHLYKSLFQECELYGLTHERVWQLASKILDEVEGLLEKDKRLYYECTFILAWGDWHQWKQLGDLRDPRCGRAIARLSEYIAYIESGESEVRMSCFVSSMDTLEKFQRAVGRTIDADTTKNRRLRVLQAIERTPEPLD